MQGPVYQQESFVSDTNQEADDSTKTAEHLEAEKYVLERPLIRPETSPLSFFKHYFVFFFCILGMTLASWYGLNLYSHEISERFLYYIHEEPVIACIVIFIVLHIIGIYLSGKKLVIGFIRLYQHYSPDFVRRNCLFKPTCSEYTILAIEKYGLRRGMKKGVDRLKRCTGEIYQVDYP